MGLWLNRHFWGGLDGKVDDGSLLDLLPRGPDIMRDIYRQKPLLDCGSPWLSPQLEAGIDGQAFQQKNGRKLMGQFLGSKMTFPSIDQNLVEHLWFKATALFASFLFLPPGFFNVLLPQQIELERN